MKLFGSDISLHNIKKAAKTHKKQLLLCIISWVLLGLYALFFEVGEGALIAYGILPLLYPCMVSLRKKQAALGYILLLALLTLGAPGLALPMTILLAVLFVIEGIGDGTLSPAGILQLVICDVFALCIGGINLVPYVAKQMLSPTTYEGFSVLFMPTTQNIGLNILSLLLFIVFIVLIAHKHFTAPTSSCTAYNEASSEASASVVNETTTVVVASSDHISILPALIATAYLWIVIYVSPARYVTLLGMDAPAETVPLGFFLLFYTAQLVVTAAGNTTAPGATHTTAAATADDDITPGATHTETPAVTTPTATTTDTSAADTTP